MFYIPHDPVDQPHSDEVMTKQSFAKECDINTILAKYLKTGQIEHVNRAAGTFSDLPPTSDYQEALNMVIQAETAFQALPSQLREHFDNDPALFLAGLSDTSGKYDEMLRQHGVIDAAVPAPQPDLSSSKPTE